MIPLFAVNNPFASVASYMKRGFTSFDAAYLAALAGGVAVLVIGFVMVDQGRKLFSLRWRVGHTLFRELCLAHQLGKTEWRLLQRTVAGRSEAEQCQVFLDPRILQTLAENGDPRANEYAQLLTRIFGAARLTAATVPSDQSRSGPTERG